MGLNEKNLLHYIYLLYLYIIFDIFAISIFFFNCWVDTPHHLDSNPGRREGLGIWPNHHIPLLRRSYYYFFERHIFDINWRSIYIYNLLNNNLEKIKEETLYQQAKLVQSKNSSS